MRWLKSLFISVFVTVLMVAAAHSVVRLVQLGPRWVWIGAALAALPTAGFFAWIFLVPTARTSANLSWLTRLVVAGLVVATLGGFRQEDLLSVPLLQTLVVTAGWLAYVYWYSRFGDRDASRLQVGSQLPDFEVEDPDGRSVSSASLHGKPMVLLFYRGNWCPLCTAQIREISDQYRELEDLGAQVALISPQPHGHTRRLAKRMRVPFLFLVDRGNRAARKLGIQASAGTPFGFQVLGYSSETVLPTVVITDSDGKILFADLTDNYRVRPEPATFLRVLRDAV